MVQEVMPEFIKYPKIGRYSRECIVTEKIDGTNAQIFNSLCGQMYVGSRNRWITPENDNHGFAAWAMKHREELEMLGHGHHFGEWWGCGIQRGYGLQNGEKRFSLFNVTRWCLFGTEPAQIVTGDPTSQKYQDILPPCVGLVPVLWQGNFDDLNVVGIMDAMKYHGSYASRGFMNPEGIVVFHTANGAMFKKTYEKDSYGKGLQE